MRISKLIVDLKSLFDHITVLDRRDLRRLKANYAWFNPIETFVYRYSRSFASFRYSLLSELYGSKALFSCMISLLRILIYRSLAKYVPVDAVWSCLSYSCRLGTG